jgi:hypothetical protein
MPYCVGLQAAATVFLSASLPTQILLVICAVSAIIFSFFFKPTKRQLIDDDMLLPMFPVLLGV